MQEELIEFKTAKLAKEKGFDLEPYLTIDSDNPRNMLSNYNPREHQPWFLTITQSLLTRWLREVHRMHTYVDCYGGIVKPKYRGCWNPLGHDEHQGYHEHYTYEEALEEVLQECLKLLPDVD